MMCSEVMMWFLSLSLSEEAGSVLWEHCEGDQTKARLLCCGLLWAGLPLISPGESFSYNPESFHISPSPWRCQFLGVNALHCEFVWYISKSMEINYWCLCVVSPNPSTAAETLHRHQIQAFLLQRLIYSKKTKIHLFFFVMYKC